MTIRINRRSLFKSAAATSLALGSGLAMPTFSRAQSGPIPLSGFNPAM